ncbi:MAG: DNRLRE domain-containing protein [Clostridia bacterium]|nr:DNRLRE domain-containing protein [Clostridia bacterium]
MKKILSLFMSVITLLSLVACAKTPDSQAKVLSDTDVTTLAKQETYDSISTVYATEATYVRGGKYKDTIPSELPQQDYYFIKYDVVENTFRTPVLKFDISDFKLPENTKSISLVVDFSTVSPVHKNFEGQDLILNVYATDNDWDSETVTYASLPALNDDDIIGSEYIIKGEVYIDIADYVLKCIENNIDTFSLRLAANVQSNAEMRIKMLGSPNGPRIVAKESGARSFYQNKILANEKANDELWAYGKEIYDAWNVRYKEILSKGDYGCTTINSNPADYTVKTNAIIQDQNNKGGTFDTRLVTTLNNFEGKNVKLDKYGGIISDKRYEATGFFRTQKVGDRWWVIDPLGYPCHITGINHTVYAYSSSEYQTKAMVRLFGGETKWALSTTAWLKDDLGFNVALASGSTMSNLLLDVQDGAATTISTGGVGSYAGAIGLNSSDGGQTNFLYNDAMPVFDPGFVEYAKEKIPATIETYADNPRILGFVSDNELPVGNDMLVNYLSLDPTIDANIYSYLAAWTWIIETTGKKGE